MLFAGWLIVALLGIALAEALTANLSGIDCYSPLVVSLGVGVGLCLSGLCYFCTLLIFPNSPLACIALEFVLFIGLMSISMPGRIKWHRAHRLRVPESRRRYTSILLLISFAVGVWVVRQWVVQSPHGGWDAVAIWNLKARDLFAGSQSLTEGRLTSEYGAHPDYPLSLPSTVASLWIYRGRESTTVPVVVACTFALATIALLYSSVSGLTTRKHAGVAALILVSTPFYLEHTAAQYADIPLAFLFLGIVVLLTLQELSQSQKQDLVVFAGILAGFAAWTKNEGLLFFLVVVVVRGTLAGARGGWRAAMRFVFYFGGGAAPLLVLSAYFKLYVAPANDLASRFNFLEVVGQLHSVSHYRMVSAAFIRQGLGFGNWFLTPLPFLILYLIAQKGSDPGRGRVFATSGFVLLFMVVGYYFVYVIQPFDLEYLLGSSLNRLLLQLWPLALFHLFGYFRSAETVYGISTGRQPAGMS